MTSPLKRGRPLTQDEGLLFPRHMKAKPLSPIAAYVVVNKHGDMLQDGQRLFFLVSQANDIAEWMGTFLTNQAPFRVVPVTITERQT
jgi:hypothetical protein